MTIRRLLTLVVVLATMTGSALGQGKAQEKAQEKPRDNASKQPTPLEGTLPLTIEGDITSQLVDGVDKFLLRELDRSVARRAAFWKPDFSSADAFNKSIDANRQRLAHILGVRDARPAFDGPELVATTAQGALVARGGNFEVFVARWPAVGGITGEGLLLVPTGAKPIADVVALPDADQTPEQLCGLVEGIPPAAQFARRLAESGCRVIVPSLINRDIKSRAPPGRQGGARLTNREYLYRSAFELGRHLIGYEVQKTLACVDWFSKEADREKRDAKIAVVGYGEGGGIALYAAALDTRIDACLTSGYFEPREGVWDQPIDRNVFGLLERFGDAELISMVHPRGVVVEALQYPEVTIAKDQGGAPATLKAPSIDAVKKEFARAFAPNDAAKPTRTLIARGDAASGAAASEPFGSASALNRLLALVGDAGTLKASDKPLQLARPVVDAAARQARQLHEIDRHNQELLNESQYVRQAYMGKLDTSSVAKYEASAEQYRATFRDDVIGAFDEKLLPFNARSRKSYETEKWIGYEVVLDVWADVIAYGVLLVPKDLKKDEKRPVVVCQHGLEGRPQDIFQGDHPAYHDFAAKLCERGFITFSPQNLYIFKDRFRTLQRKANPLKKTLFSVIVPQHQQIVNWLKAQPNVDSQRIAFYGLSYGGKSAMRIPALVTDYCLSICSADFNEWVAKNASTRLPFSYVWTGEYEIFEFDLGSTFNYAEMAALICPRPFMVERGHTDGVSTDEWVSFEYAKVRYLYSHRLKIGDRCEMEVFDGPHTINGQGTYEFLHKHLKWPRK